MIDEAASLASTSAGSNPKAHRPASESESASPEGRADPVRRLQPLSAMMARCRPSVFCLAGRRSQLGRWVGLGGRRGRRAARRLPQQSPACLNTTSAFESR
jgi:hypothetical protein